MDKKNLKITLFINRLAGGGAERVTCNLANYLFGHGFLVDVIVMADVENEFELNEGINKIYLYQKSERLSRIKRFLAREKRLKKYVVENQNVDYYVVMLPVTIWMLIRLKKLTKSKMVISERNNPRSYGFMKKALMKYSSRKSDGLVVQTEEIGNWYKSVKNKVVIPNAINKDIVLSGRTIIEKKIVSVGRLEKQKNYPMLIKAFDIFSKKYPDYILEIYGHGTQKRKIEKLIKKYGLDSKIKLMGYVKNISERISNASCFVMTSNFEGMPNALIEAMCIGIPCVSTDCDGGGAKALIRSGENGILIKKDDYILLADKMGQIVSNRHMAKKMGLKATKLKDELSNDYIYDKWLKYILSVSEGDKR